MPRGPVTGSRGARDERPCDDDDPGSTRAARRRDGRAGQAPAQAESVPLLVLCARRRHLRRPVPRADVRVVLLQPDPLDDLRLALHRLRELRQLLPRAGARLGPDPHPGLRGRHLRAQGGARPAAGPAADLTDRRPRLPALGGLLPGAGQHHRRRPDLHRADEPRARPDQRVAERDRRPRPGLADGPGLRAALGRPGRRLEGRGPGDAHLHRGHRLDPPGVLRGGPRRRRQRDGQLLQDRAPPGPPGHRHSGHPVADRRAALVRPDLGDDQRRPRLHLRRDRVGDLQAVPGGLLRPVHRRQRDPLPGRHGDHPAAVLVPRRARRSSCERTPPQAQPVAQRDSHPGVHCGLPGPVRLHRADRGERPATGRAARLLLAGELPGRPELRRRGPGPRLHAHHRVHQQHDPDGGQRSHHGRPGRDGRLRAGNAGRASGTC